MPVSAARAGLRHGPSGDEGMALDLDDAWVAAAVRDELEYAAALVDLARLDRALIEIASEAAAAGGRPGCRNADSGS